MTRFLPPAQLTDLTETLSYAIGNQIDAPDLVMSSGQNLLVGG